MHEYIDYKIIKVFLYINIPVPTAILRDTAGHPFTRGSHEEGKYPTQDTAVGLGKESCVGLPWSIQYSAPL